MFRKLLKQVGLDNLTNITEDQRESNLKRWKEEEEKSEFKPKRRDHLHEHKEPHRPRRHDLDDEHNHDDWTY